MQPVFQLRQFVHPAGGDFQHRFVPMPFGLLRQIADHRPFIALDRAGVRLAFFEDDGKQRGFARAVRPDQRHAVAVIHLERRVLEQRPRAERYLKITNDEHEIIMVADGFPLRNEQRELRPSRSQGFASGHTSRRGYGRKRSRQSAIWERSRVFPASFLLMTRTVIAVRQSNG